MILDQISCWHLSSYIPTSMTFMRALMTLSMFKCHNHGWPSLFQSTLACPGFLPLWLMLQAFEGWYGWKDVDDLAWQPHHMQDPSCGSQPTVDQNIETDGQTYRNMIQLESTIVITFLPCMWSGMTWCYICEKLFSTYLIKGDVKEQSWYCCTLKIFFSSCYEIFIILSESFNGARRSLPLVWIV